MTNDNFVAIPLENQWEYMHNLLVTHEAVVTFTKVNGEERVMPCTLAPTLLPPAPVSEGTKEEKKINKDVLRVFCTDKKEWRSFRIDSVRSIQLTGAVNVKRIDTPVL